MRCSKNSATTIDGKSFYAPSPDLHQAQSSYQTVHIYGHCGPDRVYNKSNEQNKMKSPAWAVQPANWANFDPHGAEFAISIEHAYKICQSYIGEGDMMIWKMTSGEPIKWVRVYEDESIDAVTDQHLSHLV